jgi:hypothetical protein
MQFLLPKERSTFLSMLVFWIVTPSGLVGKSSGPMMEAVFSSETMTSIYKSIGCYNPEKQHRHLNRRENLRSHIKRFCYKDLSIHGVSIRKSLFINKKRLSYLMLKHLVPLSLRSKYSQHFFLKVRSLFSFLSVRVRLITFHKNW